MAIVVKMSDHGWLAAGAEDAGFLGSPFPSGRACLGNRGQFRAPTLLRRHFANFSLRTAWIAAAFDP